jgi:uncharacterized protein with ATP-grasp and redox domains
MRTARLAGVDRDTQMRALKRAVEALAEADFSKPPAVLATRAILASGEVYDQDDPYREEKRRTTEEALRLYESIKPAVLADMAGMDPVGRISHAAKLAAAGNIIDFGIGKPFDIEATLRDTLENGFAVDHSEELYRELAVADSFLLISDNAGEIVFDRFLIDEVLGMGKRVVVSARSSGILNDAVREDLVMAGIAGPVEIIETGTGSLGLMLDETSDEFRGEFERAGVVLSKGQANYETLNDVTRSMFFILRIKCHVIGDGMGLPNGVSVLMHNGVRSPNAHPGQSPPGANTSRPPSRRK